MTRFPRVLFATVIFGFGFAIFGTGACNTDTASTEDAGGPLPEGSTDDSGGSDAGGKSDVAEGGTKNDGGGGEGGACTGTVKPATGETCVGFGKKDPCNVACGEYGYVCFNGGPPGFTGCYQMSASAFGETYCCPENKCVAMPDQNAMCSGVAGKPNRYQCPPDGAGGNVAAPAGCQETGSGGTELEKFYCCP
jgi:hypothetical protein